jgi:hypothetical protein
LVSLSLLHANVAPAPAALLAAITTIVTEARKACNAPRLKRVVGNCPAGVLRTLSSSTAAQNGHAVSETRTCR